MKHRDATKYPPTAHSGWTLKDTRMSPAIKHLFGTCYWLQGGENTMWDFADVDRQRKQIDLQIVVDVAIWEQARPIQTASSCWLLSAQSNEIQTTCHLFFSKPIQKQDTWNLENFGQSVIIVIRMTCLFCSGPNLGTSEPHVKRCHVGLTTETRKFWSDGVLESVYFYAFLASKKVSSGHSKMCSVWGLWEAYHPPYLVLTCL